MRYGRGREDSSGATGGAAAPRTELSGREATARATASVWREFIVCLYVSGGMVPSTVYGATRWRKRDWRVCFWDQEGK